MSTSAKTIDLSLVLPIYNEEENITRLYEEIEAALAPSGLSYEVIAVDDGSRDRSYELLCEMHEKDPQHWRVVKFRRNFGQTPAFAAGFDYARGEIVATMDADLQNDPADIPMLVEKMREGNYDIVSGWRIDRQDAYWSRKFPSKIANWLISKVTGVELHDYGCSLKVYHRDVVKNVKLYGEMHRFVPALANWIGVTVAEVPVNHRARQFGKSKYGIDRTVRVFLDLLTVRFLLSYSTRPIHIFGVWGLGSFGVGVLIALYLTVVKLLGNQNIGDRPLLTLAVLLIMVGVQFITMGLLGELMVRTYHESQDKPIYYVREVLEEER